MTTWMKNLVKLVVFALLLTCFAPMTTNAATLSDVSSSDSRYAAINWAVDNGYMTTTNNRFVPAEQVKEQDLLQTIAKIDKGYGYSQTTAMYYNHYGALYLPINGVTNTANRTGVVSRGQFARIYAATQGYDLSTEYAVQYLYVNEIAKSTLANPTLSDFNPNAALTKGDLAMFLQRIATKLKNNVVVNGLKQAATGADNSKITLPNGFNGGDGTVVTDPPATDGTDDLSNHPNTFKEVQSITIAKQELIANGVDSTLIKIKLKDSFGNVIPNDKALQFRVTSQNGALFSTTGNGYSSSLQTVSSDGGELSIFVTAPIVTKSVVDTIKFQLVNNNESNYATFKNKTIDVNLRYVPKPELRITYEVYDPDQANAGGNIDAGLKPLPALPVGYTPDSANIIIRALDKDLKLFDGTKVETYTNTSGVSVTGNLDVDDIQYENAKLQYARQEISVWLFEKVYEDLEQMMQNVSVGYSIDEEGRATYNYPNTLQPNYLNQFESESHAIIIYLMQFIPTNKNNITMVHYDSVKAIKKIYDSLSVTDQNKLREQFKTEIANLDAANAAVDSLKESQIISDRPANMERYTKVIVSIVNPGGQIITDYRGTVEISFNGKKRTVGFTTNTTAFNPSTGHGGAAVVYFDDIVYGYSEVSAKLVTYDSRYEKLLTELVGKTVTEKIFTNSKFEKNACDLTTEIAYVVDQSMSMRKLDTTNFIGTKTKELIAQMKAENSMAIRTSNTSYVQAKGQGVKVAATQGLFEYSADEAQGTNLASGIQAALQNFSSSASTTKAIVLVSDGKSTQTSLQNVLKQAKTAGVKVYTITVGKSADVNLTQMKRIANETGGKHYHVTDVKLLHHTYQQLLDTILCGQAMSNASCDQIHLMFEEASVSIGRSFVTLNGEVNSNCSNVAKVEVLFTSNGGDVSIPLVARGEQIYRTSKSIRIFSSFALYTKVEFIAYDQSGKIVGLKQVNIQ
jgi:hypothetical protein